MCVMSAVHDQYRPILPLPTQWPIDPTGPKPYKVPDEDMADTVKAMLDAYKQACEAARVADEITGEPDCESPEKASLLDRVAAIEVALDKLKQDIGL